MTFQTLEDLAADCYNYLNIVEDYDFNIENIKHSLFYYFDGNVNVETWLTELASEILKIRDQENDRITSNS